MTGIHDDLQDAARGLGFDLVGVTSADVLAEDLARLEAWVAAGHHADFAWMARNPPERADPRTLLGGVRSILTFAVPYPSASVTDPTGRSGRVARYAWGVDYHDVLIARLRQLAALLPTLLGGGVRTKVAVDHSPLLERAVAVRAGLGFFGKNTCLLLPRRGSFFLLGEILLDRDLPSTPPSAVETCGTCLRCLPACPTGALDVPYVLDARRCIAYLTIEHRGVIPVDLRAGIGGWVFGCDLCQEVCPFNGFAPAEAWPEFGPDHGVGPLLDLTETLTLPDEAAFQRRFAGTPLLRPKRRGLLRNAAIVARNLGAESCIPLLRRLGGDDPDPLLRSHALWALAGLDPAEGRRLAERARQAPESIVRVEAEQILAGGA